MNIFSYKGNYFHYIITFYTMEIFAQFYLKNHKL